MNSRNLFASVLMVCLLAVGSLGMAPMAGTASAGQSAKKSGEGARNYVLESKRRSRRRARVRIPLPMGPSYIYQEYPYYYSRGHYPTHIGGYVYYPSYYFGRRYNRGPGSSRRRKAR